MGFIIQDHWLNEASYMVRCPSYKMAPPKKVEEVSITIAGENGDQFKVSAFSIHTKGQVALTVDLGNPLMMIPDGPILVASMLFGKRVMGFASKVQFLVQTARDRLLGLRFEDVLRLARAWDVPPEVKRNVETLAQVTMTEINVLRYILPRIADEAEKLKPPDGIIIR